MSILKHSNKYLLALFISHVFFVILIQGGPSGQRSGASSALAGSKKYKKHPNGPGSISHSTAALSNIHLHKFPMQQISKYDTKQNVSSDNELEEMYEWHKKRRANNSHSAHNSSFQRAVIVGGGVNGLLAALHLFRSGIQVVLVDDRKEEEENVCNHIVKLNKKYIAMLKTLLGTAFKEICEQEKLPDQNIEEEHERIKLKSLKNALKKRLNSIAKYVNRGGEKKRKKEENFKEISLRVIYEHSVERIQLPTAKNLEYSAVLKPIASGKETFVPFDILVCAGGIKDKIRDANLGIPKQLIQPKKYAKGVLQKEDKYMNERLLKSVIEKENNAEVNVIFIDFLQQHKFQNHIRASHSLLGKEYEICVKSCDDIIQEVNKMKLMSSLSETGSSLYIYYAITPLLSRHFEDIEKAKRENNEKAGQYDDIKLKIVKTLLAAVAHQNINGHRKKSDWIEINMEKDPKEGMLNFDPYPENTGIFDFVQHALDNVVKQYTELGRSAIVLAVGNSAFNSHFYSGVNLDFGRLCIQMAVELIQKCNASSNIEESVNQFNRFFNDLKKSVVESIKKRKINISSNAV